MVSNRETTIASDALREHQLEELFAYYVDRLNEGDELNPQEILARHPELGADLLEYLEGYIDPDAAPSMPSDRTLGDYTIRREIGRGGMGIVYDAWQNSLDRRVALKVLPLGIAASDRAFERFMREARTAAKLDHQNIVRVYGMGVEANTPYYSMEHVEGRTLAQILGAIEAHSDAAVDAPFAPASDGSADYAGIARTFAEVADGLQHAHEKGVIHRDIKPSNLILAVDRRLRILDFGLARFEGDESLTLTGDLLGTPMYMSPEQARRRQIPIDHRTDIYSLGATLYEVLTHRPPFQGEDHRDTLNRIIEQDPQPARRFDAAIPRDFETIVLKCLRKDPRDRYQTAEALAADLRRFASGDPIEARPAPRWRSTVRWFKRRAIRIGVVVMLIALLSVVINLVLQPQEMMNQRLLTPRDMDLNNFWDMRPSPDGSRIAFTRMGSDGALCYYDFEAGEITQLTTDEWVYTSGPVWSPDGGRIAYTAGEERVFKIVDVKTRATMTPPGADGLKLLPKDWSQDGQTILCTQSLGDGGWSMVALSLKSGTVKTLVDQGLGPGCTARYSRDGRHIAFNMRENGDHDVFIIDADGGNRQRVTDATTDDESAMWSPDDDLLVYRGQSGLWSVAVDDGRVQGQPEFLRASGQSQLLYWTRDAGLFYVNYEKIFTAYALQVDSDTGMPTGPVQLPLGQSEDQMHRFAWSPDMNTIAYSTYRNERLIYIYSLKDRSLRSFDRDIARRPSNLWWTPDGTRVLYMDKGSFGLRTVSALDPTSGEMMQLFPSVDHIERVHVRPDGKEMVFYRWRDGHRNNEQRELVIAKLGQREGRVIADENEEEIGPFSNWVRPAYSPDGTQILFATRNGNLWLAAADGSSRRLLAQGPEREVNGQRGRFVKDAVWHPEGSRIVFTNWTDMFVVRVNTGEVHAIPLKEHFNESLNAVWQWSPDGKQIAFTGSRGGGPELWVVRNLLSAEAAEN